MLQGEQCCTLGSPRGSMLGSIPGMLRVGGRDPELGCFAKQNPTLHGARGLWGGGGLRAGSTAVGLQGTDVPPLPQRWRARLVFVSAALALVPSLAGCQPCGYSMYSARRAKFVIAQRINFFSNLARVGEGGGGRAGRALPALENSRGGFQRCYLLKQETFAPLPSPPPGRDGARLCGVGLFSRSACLIHKLMIELGACPKGDGCPLPTPVPPSKG